MNRGQFKDPVSHMYLAGTVVASWSLTQEVAGLQVRALLLYCNDKMTNFYHPLTKFAKVMFSQVSVCPRRGLCSRRVSVRETPWTETPPPHSKEQAVCIILESILVSTVFVLYISWGLLGGGVQQPTLKIVYNVLMLKCERSFVNH